MVKWDNRPFAVIRDAIRKQGKVALGKVVFTTRGHVIALEPWDKGMVGVTLRDASSLPAKPVRASDFGPFRPLAALHLTSEMGR